MALVTGYRASRRPVAVALLSVVGIVTPVLAQEPGPPRSESSQLTPAAPPVVAPPPPPVAPTVPPAAPTVPPPPTVPSTAAPPVPLPPTPGIRPSATFSVDASVAVTEEYTDNFFLTDTDTTENFRTALRPGLGLTIDSPFTKGRIAYTLSAAHDSSAGSSDEINFFHSLVGLVTWDASPRLKFTVSDYLTRSDEPSEADRLGLRRERGTFTTNTFAAAADYLIGRVATSTYYRLATFFEDADSSRTIAHTIGTRATVPLYQANSAGLGYEHLRSETRNDETSKVTGHRFTGSLTRQLNPLAAAGISGSYAIRSRSFDATTAGSDSGDFNMWTVSIFNSYSGPRLSLNGNIGYSRATTDAGRDRSSIFTNSSLSYRFTRAVVTVAVDSGFAETFAEGEDFGVVETRGVTATLSYPFTPAISATATASYRQNEQVGTTTTAGDDQTTWFAGIAATVRLTTWLGLVLEYRHREATGSELTSTETEFGRRAAGGDYTENRGSVSLRASF